jgi:uncharacterized glyoxalase superfamily protein PhnB
MPRAASQCFARELTKSDRSFILSEFIPLLNVEDVTKSIAFYETVLGAMVENNWEMEGRIRWARVCFEGGKLMLNTPDSASSAERKSRAEFADAVLYLMCDDAPARRERLLALGMAVSALHAEEYGNDEFAVRDPDGYAIRFSSPRGRGAA